MNDFLFVIVVTIGVMILSVLGLYLARRYVPIRILEVHNEEEGFVYAVVGVVYGVLIAFLVLVVWQQFVGATERVENEAATLSSLDRDVQCFPESFKIEFRKALVDYCYSMVNDEFPAMANGTVSTKTDSAYKKLWELFYDFVPNTDKEKYWYPEVISRINELGKSRRLRIMSIDFGIPPFMWYMVFIGGFITISYGYLLYTKIFINQAIMILFITGIICFSLIIVYALDHPFTGIIRVSDVPFREILHLIE